MFTTRAHARSAMIGHGSCEKKIAKDVSKYYVCRTCKSSFFELYHINEHRAMATLSEYERQKPSIETNTA